MPNENVQVFSFMADVLNVDLGTIHIGLSVGDIPEWDSLAQTRVVLGLEEKFGMKLSIDDVLEIESVEDIIELVQEKSVLS